MPRSSADKALGQLGAGVLPYLALTLGYHLAYSREDILLRAAYFAVGVALVVLIAVLSRYLPQRIRGLRRVREPLTLQWRHACAALVSGGLIIVIELLFLG